MIDEKILSLSDRFHMKHLAIHNGKIGWNERWIEYCQEHSVPFKAVNCHASDILDQIRDCRGLMWHFHHSKPEDMLTARNVLNAAQIMGLKVFPDFCTNWHFDDKLSQKYLFDALQLPSPPAWIFFEEKHALEFLKNCEFPIVAKLRHGAGSYNVRLLNGRQEGQSYVRRMFGRGFSPAPTPLADARNKFKVAARIGGAREVLKRIKKAPQFIRETLHARRYFETEKGYVYFQKFIPGNSCDYRLIVVGGRCWGYRRMVRERDFRASGSHMWDVDHTKIPLEVVRAAFYAADKLAMQSVAFDFVMDKNRPLITEISYGYGYDEGDSEWYWDRDENWHRESFKPWNLTIEVFLANLP